ncbi:hypothetical protein PDQ24_29230 [Bacillus cereus]|nr:hypothetical protein [Bacillus cereus]
MDYQYLLMEIRNLNNANTCLAKDVSDLQRDKDGLVQMIDVMSGNIDELKRSIDILDKKINTKADEDIN